ncbi:lantibiotic dehydratase [Streptomyces fildesensis]|uniref:Lantibiotic dehydratase n=1 Tax=Streptomyces fildesensis TaxID=375757 RepID=A0ABW8C3Q4_9ACTN
MTVDGFFRAQGPVLVRIPLLPAHESRPAPVEFDANGEVAESSWSQYLLDITGDHRFREALEVSSPSLGRVISRAESGEAMSGRQLRRAALSATRYLLRATTRPTPFGLLAGVSTANFDDEPMVRISDLHRKQVNVDAEWAEGLISDWVADPEVTQYLTVCANNLCFERGGRLVLPYVRNIASKSSPTVKGAGREVSVRNTPVVSRIMSLAASPSGLRQLAADVHSEFSQLDVKKVEEVLFSLLRKDFLVCNLASRSSGVDALGPARSVILAGDAARKLKLIDSVISDYMKEPVGRGLPAFRVAVDVLKKMVPDVHSDLRIDLRFDADITLPVSVREEAEHAASTLWRLAKPNPGPSHLLEYHEAFLERYGMDQLVPLPDLLDPHSGLDAPAGYLVPPSARHLEDSLAEFAPNGSHALDSAREEILSTLLESALLHGSEEIILDDDIVEQLAHENARIPSISADLCFQVLSESLDDLRRGRYDLSLSPFTGSDRAGSMIGRFVGLLEAGREAGAAFAPDHGEGPVVAQVHFQPTDARSLNVSTVPNLTENTVLVGAFPGSAGSSTLCPSDLAVGADHDRMYLVRARDGREVRPVVPHALSLATRAPNIVRFLAEIGSSGQGSFRIWDWGRRLKTLPYLPRVRYGRVLLSPARWRPSLALLRRDATWNEWCDRLAEWRREWNVPDRIQVAVRDRRVELDLTSDIHRNLLRDELRRSAEAMIFESPIADRSLLNWMNGYAAEIVVPLVGSAPRPSSVPATAKRHEALSAPAVHVPGGEWLYAKLYAIEELHNTILASHLPKLLKSLPGCVDRWFYIRYQDPDPHLRLRFHGDPARINSELLPAFSAWAAAAIGSRIARNLVLDTYMPEGGRYGGPAALPLAESLFQADSESAVAQLQLRAHGLADVPAEVLAALNHAHILESFGQWDWRTWVRDEFPKRSGGIGQEYRAFIPLVGETDRRVLADRIPGGDRLVDCWEHRVAPAAAYGRLLFSAEPTGAVPTRQFSSVLHMHANRILGIDREREDRSYAVLRAAALSRLVQGGS